MSWRKFLVIPQLAWHGLRAPRDQTKAWDRFWGSIRKGGPGGDVLWDAASRVEIDAVLERARRHMDASLPLVDIGCGNGRFSRAFAAVAPRVVGLDASERAVQLAQQDSGDVKNASFRVLDATLPGSGGRLAGELGEANAFIRGVFHVLSHERRLALVENLRALLGSRGTLFVTETNFEGDPLNQLELQGATLTSMPLPLHRCIAAGITPPTHFGAKQVQAYFPAEKWNVLESGPTITHGVPLHRGVEIEDIPSYFAVVRNRLQPARAA